MSDHRFTIDRCLADKRLLGAALGPAETWQTWLTILKASFSLKLTAKEREVFDAVAGGRDPPVRPVRELWALAGRRCGKSKIAAACAVYLAAFVKHKLSVGEVGTVLVISGTRDQSKSVFNFIKGYLEASPVLSREVASTTAHEVTLRNGIVIGVHSNSFRSVRGRSLVACIFDEVSFWRDESSSTPDSEVYRAVKPALATTKGPLIAISSPYRKLGLMFQKHRDHFGVAGDILVVQGASKTFNPSLDDDEVAAQRAVDPESALSEWDAEFRSDLSAFLDDRTIDSSTDFSRPLELPPRSNARYVARVDPSGLAVGGDQYALAISHREGEQLVVDGVWAKRGPANPKNATLELAAICRCYNISTVVGDRYAAEWVTSAWAESGIRYTNSELSASELYLEALPWFMRGLVRLPNHPQLLRELRLLERITTRAGKDQVSHPRGGHDDLANAVCASLTALVRGPGAVIIPQELLGRIAAMPRRREHGSTRAQNLMFSPLVRQQSVPDSWNPRLRERN